MPHQVGALLFEALCLLFAQRLSPDAAAVMDRLAHLPGAPHDMALLADAVGFRGRLHAEPVVVLLVKAEHLIRVLLTEKGQNTGHGAFFVFDQIFVADPMNVVVVLMLEQLGIILTPALDAAIQ